MPGPCPHYNETERRIGSHVDLVCRDCGARLARTPKPEANPDKILADPDKLLADGDEASDS